jgi:3-deoxy-manno-octulosonate cytidylyltransferase (CMP-KDO synthetase)
MSDTAVIVIPARLAATRLPRKPLALIGNKPMIHWVYERAKQVRNAACVVVATPDDEIADAVQAFGGEAILTSDTCRTGTDRVAEAVQKLGEEYSIIANVQGDEPMLDPLAVEQMITALTEHPRASMATVCCPLPAGRETDPNAVKVVTALSGNALYFSRSLIPYPRDRSAPAAPKLHLGLYAFRRPFLFEYAAFAPTPLEQAESLEQLRALENGYTIRVIETTEARNP